MCIRVGILLLIGSLLLGTAALCDDAADVLRIQIPKELDPAKAIVLVGQYGNGLAFGPASRENASCEYTADIDKSTKSVKVLIYYPGCKLVMAEMQRADLAVPFAPKFEELTTVSLTIKLTRSNGKPIAGQTVSLRQPLLEMEFFGYVDGPVWDYTAPPVASGVTDASGGQTVKLPLLLDDPAFAVYKTKAEFSVGLNDSFPQKMGYDFVPPSIPAQKSYADSVPVKLVYRGRISGQMKPSFPARHGITAPLGSILTPSGSSAHKVWFRAHQSNGKSGQGSAVKADGSFSMTLPAGKYDLFIEVTNEQGFAEKTIPIRKGVVIGENEDRKVVLE
jgi:hypothetical protein